MTKIYHKCPTCNECDCIDFVDALFNLCDECLLHGKGNRSTDCKH